MPLRKTPLINEQIYHVFNRSVAQQPIFRNKKECDIFTSLIEYYKFKNPPKRFSHFQRLSKNEKSILLNFMYKSGINNIEIYAFCLMPNHYHLLVKQISENGISNSIRLIQNSYARYLNIKSKRHGALFQSPFKAVRIASDEQFVHVARYIHLNPLTTYLLENFSGLENYLWGSYKDYVTDKPRKFLDISFLMTFYKNVNKLKKFTADNLNYQRELEKIKHLIID